MADTHTHEWTTRRSGGIEFCACGKWRFSAAYLATHPAIVEIPARETAPRATGKIHSRSTRLYVNGGIAFPLCKANARLLDMDASRLATTGDDARVTCARCLQVMRASASASTPRVTWTIAQIADANTRAGYFFFSRDTLRFFGDTRASFRVKEEHGRVFIIRTRRQRNAPAGYCSIPEVREFDPATGDISGKRASVAEFVAPVGVTA